MLASRETRMIKQMIMIDIRIHPKIFENHPTFRRGIVIARNLNNQGHSPELEKQLNRAIGLAAEAPIDIKTDPLATDWNEAHRQFGSNPNKFPPAHCALLKRVQKPGARLPFINKVVAIMNINSIEARTPVGGDADVCFVPNIETGNVFYKLLTILGKAKVAGIIVGAKVPVVLTSRADSDESKYLSIVTALKAC